MAASIKSFKYIRHFAFKFQKSCLFKSKQLLKAKNKFPFIASALVAKLTCESKSKIEEPDASQLSREYLIKSASVVTAQNAIILLTQTALALQQAEQEYKEAMLALVSLIEYKLTVLGNSHEEARIWDYILQGRDLVSTTKKERDNLDILYKSTWNLVNISAEVLYMTGAEMVGIGASERLVHIEKVIHEETLKREDAEERLRVTEVKSINVEGKYAEEHAAELDEELKALATQYSQHNDETSNQEDDAKSETDMENSNIGKTDNTDVFDDMIKLDETEIKDSAQEL